MSDPGKAVFLSYASQDADAARRICEALRAAGVEVWFDQNELVGGDAWDAKIRKQIRECALFIPIISANTQARREGYFRREWNLAAARTLDMARGKPFLLPVVIDATSDATADVPDEFCAVQWTRLPAGEAGAGFCARVSQLLRGDAPRAARNQGPDTAPLPAPSSRAAAPRMLWLGGGLAVLVAGIVAFALRPGGKPAREPEFAPAPPDVATASGALTEAQQLVAQARQVYEQGDELNRENLFLAEDLVKRAIERDPAEASAWEFAAWLSYTMIWHSIDGSAARIELLNRQAARALTLAPRSITARVVSAHARIAPAWGSTIGREKAVQEVERELVELARQEPRNWQIQRALGNAHRFLHRADDSIAALQRALEFSGGSSGAAADLANVLIRRGRHEEAEAVVAAALARKPTARLRVFDVLLKTRWRGDTAGAITALESEAWPSWLTREDRGAFFAWQTYLWANRPEQALAIGRGIPREYLRDANFAGPRAVLTARALERAGRNDAARADWRTVVQSADRELATQPNELSALYWKAWALSRLGDTAAAHALCGLILQRTQGDEPVFLKGTHLAALLATAGMIEAALQELRTYRTATNDGYIITRAVLELDPAYDTLRGDPRFASILEAAPAPVSETPPSRAAEITIAVLAFENRSDDRANEYLCDGISEELILVLGRVPGLRVSARTSAFFFKGKSTPLREIAQQLGVAYLVEGSVRKEGDRVRVSATLIKADDGFRVWSDRFDREVKDAFALQDEIAALVAQKLSLQLGAAANARTPLDPRVLELYTEARLAWNRRTPEGFAHAERALQQALEIDPKFVRAHAALTDVWGARGQLNDATSPWHARGGPDLARLLAKCEQALALDPKSSEAHASLGGVNWVGWRFLESERALREAIRLNPNNASAHQWLGRTLLTLGRMDEAMTSLTRAAELDPLAPRILDNAGWALLLAGRIPEASAMLDRALALQPDANQALGLKAVALAMSGEPAAAAKLARRVSNEGSLTAWLRVQALALAGESAEANALLAGYREGNLIAKLCGLAALGRHEEALQSLEVSWLVATRVDWLLYHPIFDPMRADPRFHSAIRTIGLEDAHARAQAWRAAKRLANEARSTR